MVAGIDQSASAMGAPTSQTQIVNHTTIYRLIAKDRTAGGQLYRCLWSSGRKRWKGGKRHSAGRDYIARRVDISEHPEEVDCRIGDWEGIQ